MKNGFTIIELAIAIFILAVAVVGISTAFSIIVGLTSDVSNQLTATYLAQEGAEIATNIRDTNWLNMYNNPTSGYAWLDNINFCDNGCEADYTSNTNSIGAFPVNPWQSRSLYVNDVNGFYQYNTIAATQTKFKRKIIIAPVTDNDGKADHIVNVTVQVSWDKKANMLSSAYSAGSCNTNNCITIEYMLYDWFNNISQ